MTLKAFLEQNRITATPDERSSLGRMLAELITYRMKVVEDGHLVLDYPIRFLKSDIIVDVILQFFKDIEINKLSETF